MNALCTLTYIETEARLEREKWCVESQGCVCESEARGLTSQLGRWNEDDLTTVS